MPFADTSAGGVILVFHIHNSLLTSTKKRFAAGTIMKVTYGHTVRSTDELYVRLAEEAGMDTVTGGSPGSVLVDFFPARTSVCRTLTTGF